MNIGEILDNFGKNWPLLQLIICWRLAVFERLETQGDDEFKLAIFKKLEKLRKNRF